MSQPLDSMMRDYLSVGLWPALAFVVILAVAGAAVGLAFPKWNAEALLETPGVVIPSQEPRDRERTNEAEPKVKVQYVTLSEFRKMASAYSSDIALNEYLVAAKKAETPAGSRLARQAQGPGFWSRVASPVLPFSRRDAREFGDLKDAASDSLVGVDLATDARTPELANEMLGVVSNYFSNALIRERIRGWVLKNRGEAPAKQKALRAEVVDAQMKIETMGHRIQDLKTVLARYPEAAKLESRQVVNITEGSDRFLSPVAQLVAAETSISQLKETIARKERQARQFDLAERYFADADEKLKTTVLATDLVPALAALTAKRYEGIDPETEWAREVIFRVQADLAGFSSALSSFGVRNQPRVEQAMSRDPARLAAFGAGLGILVLGLVAFIRASLRSRAREDDVVS